MKRLFEMRHSEVNGRKGRFIHRPRLAAVLVEFAVVLPLVVVFSFGMIELARLLMLQHTADTAAYEGARQAMVPGATAGEAIEAAQAMLDAAELKDASISVTPALIEESTPVVTVNVIIPIKPNSWVAFFNLGDLDVSSEVSLFCERPAVVRLSGLPVMKAKKNEKRTRHGFRPHRSAFGRLTP
jgi:hypothetical protein